MDIFWGFYKIWCLFWKRRLCFFKVVLINNPPCVFLALNSCLLYSTFFFPRSTSQFLPLNQSTAEAIPFLCCRWIHSKRMLLLGVWISTGSFHWQKHLLPLMPSVSWLLQFPESSRLLSSIPAHNLLIQHGLGGSCLPLSHQVLIALSTTP